GASTVEESKSLKNNLKERCSILQQINKTHSKEEASFQILKLNFFPIKFFLKKRTFNRYCIQ
ncbi:hypothetical protein TNCT_684681, partial [Trichonephila clavata]